MWNFTRSRQTAGNICLVLFTAFLFTILVAPFGMVGSAEAASFVDKNGAGVTSKTIYTDSNGVYSILVNLAVDPITDPDFNTMQIKFDLGNNKVISVYAKDIVESVYTTAYAKVYTLVYKPAAEFQNPVYTTIYGKLYVGDNPYQNLILTMNIKPPETAEPVGDLPLSEGSGTGSAALPEGTTEVVFDEGESLDVNAQVSSVVGTTVNVAGVATDLTNLTVNGQAEDITQVTAIGGQAFTVEKAVALESGVANEPIVITNAAVNGSSVSIPDGTKVMTKAGWNGKISPPTVVAAAAVTGNPPAGFNVTTTKVIKFGSDDVSLLFDKPVTFVLPNTTGDIAYRVPGSSTWVRITNLAAGTYANPTAPVFPQEAYISDGINTKIITWHATEFAPITTVGGSPGSSSPGPSKPVTVTSNFGDIASHWAKDDIELLFSKGIIAGITDKQFAPDATITRAQFATLLVKALGLADAQPANATFKDVKSGAWYYGAVEAAAANGLVAGSNGSFNPEGQITRQEMAAMVANALKVGGKDVSADTAELDKFSDKSEIANWAQSSVAVAVKEGIITGRTATTVVPKANATRAEGTVMIKKVLSSLGEL